MFHQEFQLDFGDVFLTLLENDNMSLFSWWMAKSKATGAWTNYRDSIEEHEKQIDLVKPKLVVMETALLESIEGHRGQPRFKPPYPTVNGLWNSPTVVSNVETLANLPFILVNGADNFASIGAKNYPGTKLLTLSGDINNPGCYEVPTDYSFSFWFGAFCLFILKKNS